MVSVTKRHQQGFWSLNQHKIPSRPCMRNKIKGKIRAINVSNIICPLLAFHVPITVLWCLGVNVIIFSILAPSHCLKKTSPPFDSYPESHAQGARDVLARSSWFLQAGRHKHARHRKEPFTYGLSRREMAWGGRGGHMQSSCCVWQCVSSALMQNAGRG